MPDLAESSLRRLSGNVHAGSLFAAFAPTQSVHEHRWNDPPRFGRDLRRRRRSEGPSRTSDDD
jgi:hypothetical protein